MRQVRLLAVTVMAVFAVMLFGAGPALCADAPAKQPKIEANPPTFDFGKVKEGEKPVATFTLKNTGNADLIIYETKPSCGCTVASLSCKDNKIAPGQTATLECVYNSHNASGQVHKSVNVRSNDPVKPSFTLGITGTVESEPAPDIMLDAFNAVNLKVRAGGSETRAIRVTNPGQLDLTISEITASAGISAKIENIAVGPGKTAKANLVIRPGEARLLDITITPKSDKGNFQEVLTIRSNSKRRPAVSFVANGTIGG